MNFEHFLLTLSAFEDLSALTLLPCSVICLSISSPSPDAVAMAVGMAAGLASSIDGGGFLLAG